MVLPVPYHRQSHDFSCGPACLRMLFAYHEVDLSEDELVAHAKTSPKRGTTDKAMANVVRMYGFTCSIKTNALWSKVVENITRGKPVLIKYIEPKDEERHFALIVGIKDGEVFLNDPWNGEKFNMPIAEFKNRWLGGVRDQSKEKGWMMTIAPRTSGACKIDTRTSHTTSGEIVVS